MVTKIAFANEIAVVPEVTRRKGSIRTKEQKEPKFRDLPFEVDLVPTILGRQGAIAVWFLRVYQQRCFARFPQNSRPGPGPKPGPEPGPFKLYAPTATDASMKHEDR
uniref:Uncharacterized protein n=1 Tax=Steinernema glaseri TaxID=37863 RepID=A0A1I7YGU4_9BILA